jgi:hypothetical protein
MICTNIQIFKQFKEAMKVLSPDVQQEAINAGLSKTIIHSEFEISLAIIELMYSCISDETHSGVRDKAVLNVLKKQVCCHTECELN